MTDDPIVVFSFKGPQGLRDAVDRAVRQHPNLFADRSAALRAGTILFLRTLKLIGEERKMEEGPVGARSPQAEGEIAISEVIAVDAKR